MHKTCKQNCIFSVIYAQRKRAVRSIAQLFLYSHSILRFYAAFFLPDSIWIPSITRITASTIRSTASTACA